MFGRNMRTGSDRRPLLVVKLDLLQFVIADLWRDPRDCAVVLMLWPEKCDS